MRKEALGHGFPPLDPSQPSGEPGPVAPPGGVSDTSTIQEDTWIIKQVAIVSLVLVNCCTYGTASRSRATLSVGRRPEPAPRT